MNPPAPPVHVTGVDELIQRGLAASQAHRVEEAMAFLQEAARRAPESGLPHFLIGAELAQLGRMDEAEMAYANAVLLAPALDMARYQLGLIQFTSGRAALALVTWGPLFQTPPDSALQRIVRGFAALAQDDFAAATACFREGMALNLDNAALNRDMQLMLDRIEAHTQAAAPAPAPAPAPGQAVPQEVSGGEQGLHVLLSNYQQRGPLH
jgi:Flp pilus assembly protein TadD